MGQRKYMILAAAVFIGTLLFSYQNCGSNDESGTPPASENGNTGNGMAPGQIFQDVSPSNPFYNFINILATSGITTGCSNTTPPNFCPNQPVTRAQMAVFVLMAKNGPGYRPPAATGVFTDVPVSSPFAPFVEKLKNDGVVTGCTANSFCPNNPVPRDQAALFIMAVKHGVNYPLPQPPYYFQDIQTNPFRGWIQLMHLEGVAGGCGPGPSYCPSLALKRGEAAVFLVKAFGL